MKSVMVTGATGFIGSHITERLLSEGVSTTILARRKSALADLLEKRGAKVFIGDSKGALRDALRYVDTVIHCAGATLALNEREYLKANPGFTSEILTLLKEGQKFLLLSSQAASGPSRAEIPLDEKDPENPVTSYGRSKLAAEQRVCQWGAKNHMRYTIMRPSIVYGPRERNLFYYFKLANSGFFTRVAGQGKKKFSMLHIDDLAGAITLAAAAPFTGETYFVSNDEGYSWEDFEASLKKGLKRSSCLTLKVPVSFIWLAASFFRLLSLFTRKPGLVSFEKVREITQPGWLCSNQKVKEKLKWKPLLNLDEGVARTAEWYLREGWITRTESGVGRE